MLIVVSSSVLFLFAVAVAACVSVLVLEILHYLCISVSQVCVYRLY